jgi:hypothetical protein
LASAAVALGVAGARSLHAQTAHGIVRDSTSRLPVAGAVVSTLDSLGRVGLRTLTNERGAFRIPAAPPAHRIRVVRLGFRPVEVPIPQGVSDAEMDVVLTSIPYALQPVRVLGGQRCPRRRDRAAALALLEQARAGLLATVVARSEKPARMKRLAIDRRHDGTSDRVIRHSVRVDTVARSVAAFVAAHSATDFVKDGFAADGVEGTTYHAPDADVLLDDGFANGYCFHIMERDRARPNQVGLGFRAADRQRGRVDVDGALWIDTVARALVDITYRYVGLAADAERLEPGGHVAFREMPNGVVLIDRWMLRLVGSESDSGGTTANKLRDRTLARQRRLPSEVMVRPVLAEVGGELARVSWPDGIAWQSDLGRLSLTLTNRDGEPMRGMRVRLDDTNYEATTDSTGHLEIVDLAPGPYSGGMLDPRVEPINLTLPMPLAFAATRGAIISRRVRAGTLEDYVGDLCRQDKSSIVGNEPMPAGAWIIGRVSDPSGESVQGIVAGVAFSFRDNAREPTSSSNAFETFYKIGTDGVFAFCSLKRDVPAEITFKRGTQILGTVSQLTNNPVNVVAVRLDFAPKRP